MPIPLSNFYDFNQQGTLLDGVPSSNKQFHLYFLKHQKVKVKLAHHQEMKNLKHKMYHCIIRAVFSGNIAE